MSRIVRLNQSGNDFHARVRSQLFKVDSFFILGFRKEQLLRGRWRHSL